MVSKEFFFANLVLLSLISFGSFGSLSHLFTLILTGVFIINFFGSKNTIVLDKNSKILFFALCSIFFIFVLRGFFYDDTWKSLESLSPMLPLPIIGLMILFQFDDKLRISAAQLALFAKVSVFIAFFLYFLLAQVIGDQFGLGKHFIGRLELFSGNPIPFSAAIFGVTIFCFSNWPNATNLEKFSTLLCCVLGIYLAGLLSGTRGTFLAIILSGPIFLWLVFRSWLLAILIVFLISLLGVLLQLSGLKIIDIHYLERIIKGSKTLVTSDTSDTGIIKRLTLWNASILTIIENPFFGYDVSNRFTALKPNLPNSLRKVFTHPHNDIFASMISVGLVGGFLSIICLFSPIWAAVFSKERKPTKLVIGSAITITILTTANVNTVFFNDITCAWLAFSTFLIWNFKFEKNLNFKN